MTVSSTEPLASTCSALGFQARDRTASLCTNQLSINYDTGNNTSAKTGYFVPVSEIFNTYGYCKLFCFFEVLKISDKT
jgi:hypothetical protein